MYNPINYLAWIFRSRLCAECHREIRPGRKIYLRGRILCVNCAGNEVLKARDRILYEGDNGGPGTA